MKNALFRQYAGLLIVATIIAIIGGVVGATAYHMHAHTGTILPGVTVAGINVAGLSPEEAERRLSDHIHARLREPIYIFLAGESWTEIPADLGLTVDLKNAVHQAVAVGHVGNVVDRILDRLTAVRDGIDLTVPVKVDQQALDSWLASVASRFEKPPKNASLRLGSDGDVEIIPSQSGYVLDTRDLAHRLAAASLRATARSVRIPLKSVEPVRSTADVQASGAHSLMGAYVTSFDPADVNRTTNIRISAKALDGVVLQPDEVFSFNQVVGPRVEAHGYKEAPVIIDGELVPDIGGGVCQVSSTLYNAVLLAGLKVVTRVPHSIPSAYVPLGRDATVAYDYIDFKFQNNTGAPVLIKSWVEDDQVMVAFYGHDSGYTSTRLETEVVEVIEPNVTYVTKDELQPGSQHVVQHGRTGYRVNVWRVVQDHQGSVSRELASRSFYPPRDRIIWTGS